MEATAGIPERIRGARGRAPESKRHRTQAPVGPQRRDCAPAHFKTVTDLYGAYESTELAAELEVASNATTSLVQHETNPEFRREVMPEAAPIEEDRNVRRFLAEEAGDRYMPPAHPVETDVRHWRWKDQRKLILESFERTHLAAQRIERFKHCGSDAFVYQHETSGALKLVANFCRDRWCQPCGRHRASCVKRNVKKKLKAPDCKHIVITTQHSDKPLCDQIDRILQAFAKLRARKVWKNRIHGGAYFLETKRNNDTHTWHVHLHVLSQGRFLPQGELSDAWQKITKDSFRVWVERIFNRDDAAEEVAKYATKPIDPSVLVEPDALDEMIRAYQGRHLLATFGSWRKLELMKAEEEIDPAAWRPVDSLVNLVARADSGEEHAKRLLELLLQHSQPETGPPGLFHQRLPSLRRTPQAVD